jgi:glucose uptake protein
VILGLLCWGSWANAYKISGRWRFEFFYYDFTWGLVLAIAVAAFTLGSMNQQELTFQDIFLLTGYRKMAWALSAGVMLNVGTMLALAAMVLAGMSLAFPVSLGLAAMLGVILGIVENSQGALGLPFAGAVLLTLGVGLSILAYTWNVGDRQLAEQKAFIADPRTKAPPKKASPVRGVVLAVLGAIFLAIGRPMLRISGGRKRRRPLRWRAPGRRRDAGVVARVCSLLSQLPGTRPARASAGVL